jgi:dihydroorotate dehydrogenase electron transfer subunit
MMEALRAAAREDDRLELSLEEHMACGAGVCRTCVVPLKDGESWRYGRVCREGPVFDADELHHGSLDEEDGHA